MENIILASICNVSSQCDVTFQAILVSYCWVTYVSSEQNLLEDIKRTNLKSKKHLMEDLCKVFDGALNNNETFNFQNLNCLCLLTPILRS